MYRDKQDLLERMERGKVILNERPEIHSMALDQVIDLLEDGTEQMLEDRWAVAAWILVQQVHALNFSEMVQTLSPFGDNLLTTEHVGFILQEYYHISLVELLIEADKQGQYENIEHFVSNNLQFLSTVQLNLVSPLLQLISKHTIQGKTSSILYHYAQGVVQCDSECVVLDEIGAVDCHAKYELAYQVCTFQERKKGGSIGNHLRYFRQEQDIWGKRLFLALLAWNQGQEILTEPTHFGYLETMIHESDELWGAAIPVLVRFVMYAQSENQENRNYQKSVAYLQSIPTGTEPVRRCFLREVQINDATPTIIFDVFGEITSTPFADDCPLADFDDYFHLMVQRGHLQECLEKLFVVYKVNQFGTKHSGFTERMYSLCNLLSKNAVEVTKTALKYMLSSGMDGVLFGMDLLNTVGNVDTLFSDDLADFSLSNTQAIRILKAYLYLNVDGKRVCRLACQLIKLVDTTDCYEKFCLDDLFRNYPKSMYDASQSYLDSGNSVEACLATAVQNAYHARQEQAQRLGTILDLQLSAEQEMVLRRADTKQRSEIKRRSEINSFWGQFFPSRHLKYGNRSGHIIRGKKNKRFYRSTPYQTISVGMELLSDRSINPIDYYTRKQEFIEEVMQDAVDN